MRLGSDEYLKEAQRKINEDSLYEKLGKDVEDSYTLVLEAEPSKGVDTSVIIGFSIVHGIYTT